MNDVNNFSELGHKIPEIQRVAEEKLWEEIGFHLSQQGHELGDEPAHEPPITSLPPAFRQAIRDALKCLEDFTTIVDPARFDELKNQLDAPKSALTDTVTGLIDDAKNELGDWTGSAADEFDENYLQRFLPLKTNHLDLIAGLSTILDCSRKIAEESRNSALEIADKTLTALNNIKHGDGSESNLVLSVVGAVVGVVSAVASGGTATAVLALVGGGIAIAGGATTYVAKENEISGGTVFDVLGSLNDNVGKLHRAIAAEEDTLRKAVTHDMERIATDLHDHYLVARPQIVDTGTAHFKPPAD